VPSSRPRVAVKLATVRRLVKTGWAQRCLRRDFSPKERGVLNHSAQKKSDLNRTETLNRHQPKCKSAQKFSTELKLPQKNQVYPIPRQGPDAVQSSNNVAFPPSSFGGANRVVSQGPTGS